MIAGENIAGKKSEYEGTVSTFASVVGDLEIACTGLNSHYAKQAGIEVVSGKSISTDTPEWFGEKKRVILKILADRKGRVIGAQSIGRNAFSRINVVSTAISAGMSLADLRNVELSYCPAISQTIDVLHQAVDIALRK